MNLPRSTTDQARQLTTTPSTARSLQDAESRGWGTAIRSVLSAVVPGTGPEDWQLSSTVGHRRRALMTTTGGPRKLLQQAASSSGDGSSLPPLGLLPTQWRHLSRTPSLDAWRLGQPGPAGSLCATQLCAALLAAGVDLDPASPLTISPDPTNNITSLRASAQMEVWRASEAAARAAEQQRRIGAIVGAAVGGFAGLVVLLAALPRVWRWGAAKLTVRRAAASKAAAAAEQPSKAADHHHNNNQGPNGAVPPDWGLKPALYPEPAAADLVIRAGPPPGYNVGAAEGRAGRDARGASNTAVLRSGFGVVPLL